MPDLIGKTLGGYRIIERIGLGGMATVFKAYQPSMDRYVALKIISTHLTQDPTFVKRFRQEAKVIARLEHVYILPVYDHGEEDGYLYLVMRFIQAGTLKDRLEGAPLSLAEVRHIVSQVGSALEYAHQMGVVHRDLKPSNVLIDAQGDCYLTDFGIAKMVESTLGLTGSSVLGTPHYMAPEQSQALKVDHRADVYAMGVILYEMVTGRVPFDAETPIAVALKHITEPLPLPRSIKPDLSETVEWVILKALAKAPDDRYQSMRDLVAAFGEAVQTAHVVAPVAAVPRPVPPTPIIAEGVEGGDTAVVPPPIPVPAWRRWSAGHPLWLLAAAGLALLVLVLAGLTLSRISGRPEISGGQVGAMLPTATETAVAATLAKPTETSEAIVTATFTPQPTAMPASTHTATPSPTSVPTATHTPIPTPTSTATSTPMPPTDTPMPTPTPTPPPTPTNTLLPPTPTPSPTPSGRIAFTSDRDGNAEIYVMNSDGSEVTRLTDSHPAKDFSPAWSPDGTRIAFVSDRDDPHLPGCQVYERGRYMCNLEIYVMNADGSGVTRLTDDPAGDLTPSWSPDGTRIAFTRYHSSPLNPEVYVMNADGSGQTNLSKDFAHEFDPCWSPDSTRIAFASDRDGEYEIYVMNADGSGVIRLTNPPVSAFSPSWSPDGTRIAFEDKDAIYVMNADGSEQTMLTVAMSGASSPSWSLDGTRIAFVSNKGGNEDICVMNADGSELACQMYHPANDSDPSWAP